MNYYFIIGFILLLSQFNTKTFELTDLAIEYEKAVGTNRMAYQFDGHGDKVGELNLVMRNEWKRVYNTVRIDSVISEAQFSNVALDTELGISWKPIDLYIQHRSEHILDAQLERNYPNENSIGVRVKLVR